MLNRRNFEHIISNNKSVLFITGSSKSTRNSNNQYAFDVVQAYAEGTIIVDLLKDQNLFDQLLTKSPWKTLPQLFVNGEFVCGALVIHQYFASGEHAKRIGLTAHKQLRSKFSGKKLSAFWRIAETNEMLIAACADGHMHVLERSTLSRIKKIKLSKGWVNSVSVIDNYAYLGDTEGKLHKVSLNGNFKHSVIAEVGAWINDITPINENSALIFIDGEGALHYLEINSNKLHKIASLGSIGWSVANSPSSKIIAVGLNDGRLVMLDQEGKITYNTRIYAGPVTSLINAGEKFYAGGFEPYLSILDPSENSLSQYAVHRDRIWDIKFASGLIVSSSGDMSISIFDPIQECLKLNIACSIMPIMLSSCNSSTEFGVFYSDGSAECINLESLFHG